MCRARELRSVAAAVGLLVSSAAPGSALAHAIDHAHAGDHAAHHVAWLDRPDGGSEVSPQRTGASHEHVQLDGIPSSRDPSKFPAVLVPVPVSHCGARPAVSAPAAFARAWLHRSHLSHDPPNPRSPPLL